MLEKLIKKYIEVIQTKDFGEYTEEFTQRVKGCIEEGYCQDKREPDIVKDITEKVNDLKALTKGRFQISSKGAYIHGNKSQVEFEYKRRKTQRELGDLLFLLTVVYQGKKFFERFTITQFKKSKGYPRWNFNKKDSEGRYPDREQLYLLSEFPTFKGAKGSIIPACQNYNLHNYSNCLGSYGFLHKPGDFVFVSAKLVGLLIRKGSSVSKETLLSLFDALCPCPCYFPFYMRYWEGIFCDWCELFEKFYRYRLLPYIYPRGRFFWPMLGNSLLSRDVCEFTANYLMANIGEIVFAYGLPHNAGALAFLKQLMKIIQIKARKEKQEELSQLAEDYFSISYSSAGGQGGEGGEGPEEFPYEEGGGIGIIYTVIDLGEGQ